MAGSWRFRRGAGKWTSYRVHPTVNSNIDSIITFYATSMGALSFSIGQMNRMAKWGAYSGPKWTGRYTYARLLVAAAVIAMTYLVGQCRPAWPSAAVSVPQSRWVYRQDLAPARPPPPRHLRVTHTANITAVHPCTTGAQQVGNWLVILLPINHGFAAVFQVGENRVTVTFFKQNQWFQKRLVGNSCCTVYWSCCY